MTSNKSDRDPDSPLFRDVFNMSHKFEYIKNEGKFKNKARYGDQEKENCIICKIANKDPHTEAYEVYRDDEFLVFLNLFPYTSGHLLVSPINHVQNLEDLSDEMVSQFCILIKRSIEIIKNEMKTNSVNVGWNEGPFAGGSIKHFHTHIVPRYPSELNFIEIIGQTRPIIQSLDDTLKILQDAFKRDMS
jgi:diadenosine tetraphosphate (Ap4A) HIT family hydrolase